jgi:hypothetical protein
LTSAEALSSSDAGELSLVEGVGVGAGAGASVLGSTLGRKFELISPIPTKKSSGRVFRKLEVLIEAETYRG